MADIKLRKFEKGWIYVRSNVDEVEHKPDQFYLFFSKETKTYDNTIIFKSKRFTNFYQAEDYLEDFKLFLEKSKGVKNNG